MVIKEKNTLTPSLGIVSCGMYEGKKKTVWEVIEVSNILKWWSGFNKSRREKECLEMVKDDTQFYW